ncbi:MAG: TIGR04282 family arsenosugar biosynthesis glycosyltransferase [Piscinibacter sp.]
MVPLNTEARCAVIVMAKAPVPGLAKTRLIPALGADGAAALASRMLAHAVGEALAAGIGPVTLCGAPDAAHPAFAALAGDPRLRLQAQGEGDLGARMRRAFERALAVHPHAVLIGTDAPALDAAVLRAAAAALTTHDAVFAPAHDGGYALIGLRHAEPRLFEAMPWSTAQVMALTRERLRDDGLRWHELAALHDIDEPADLVHLAGRGWL